MILVTDIDRARKFPINYTLIFSFTCCQAYIVGSFCLEFDPKIVVEGAFMAALMMSVLTFYASC